MTSEPAPVDIREIPALAALVKEVAATGKRRRLTLDGQDVAVLLPVRPPSARGRRVLPAAAPSIDDDTDPVLVELARRRRQGLGVADQTAGIFHMYARHPPPTPREEKDAFERAVADQVMESMRG
jgi:hypothetical protein